MQPDTHYIGNELELFSHAHNWKKYWGNFVRPFLGKRVLEVGSGLGGTTLYLLDTPGIEKWVCLEPDEQLSLQATQLLSNHLESGKAEIRTEYLSGYPTDQKFDSIIYADVIEHIEDDAKELRLAASFLKKGGYLIIIVPAHQFLFSEFDQAIGHFRRYSRSSLNQVIPPDIKVVHSRYLDAVGLLASLSNKLMLRQRYPSIGQVKFWDSVIVPVSRLLDRLFSFHLGKSVLFIGRKED